MSASVDSCDVAISSELKSFLLVGRLLNQEANRQKQGREDHLWTYSSVLRGHVRVSSEKLKQIRENRSIKGTKCKLKVSGSP